MLNQINAESTSSHCKKQYKKQVTFLVLYYAVVLGFALWLLFDVWSSRNYIFRLFAIWDKTIADPLFKTMAYAIIGGAIGSILYGLRMVLHYYAKENEVYNPRYFLKYVTSPFVGAVLAIIVIAIIRGGVAMFGGPLSPSKGSESIVVGNFASFGVGALIGMGASNAMRWIIQLAAVMFKASASDGSPQQQPTSKADEGQSADSNKFQGMNND